MQGSDLNDVRHRERGVVGSGQACSLIVAVAENRVNAIHASGVADLSGKAQPRHHSGHPLGRLEAGSLTTSGVGFEAAVGHDTAEPIPPQQSPTIFIPASIFQRSSRKL